MLEDVEDIVSCRENFLRDIGEELGNRLKKQIVDELNIQISQMEE